MSCNTRFLVVDSLNNVMKPGHVGYLGPDNPKKGSGSFRGPNAKANASNFALHLTTLPQNKGASFYILEQVACVAPALTVVDTSKAGTITAATPGTSDDSAE